MKRNQKPSKNKALFVAGIAKATPPMESFEPRIRKDIINHLKDKIKPINFE